MGGGDVPPPFPIFDLTKNKEPLISRQLATHTPESKQTPDNRTSHFRALEPPLRQAVARYNLEVHVAYPDSPFGEGGCYVTLLTYLQAECGANCLPRRWRPSSADTIRGEGGRRLTPKHPRYGTDYRHISFIGGKALVRLEGLRLRMRRYTLLRRDGVRRRVELSG